MAMPVPDRTSATRASDLGSDWAAKESADVLQFLRTSPTGLTDAEAAARLEQIGPNEIAREKKQSWVQRLYLAARNPLVILLTVLAILALATQDYRSGTVMLLMVALGLSLRFVQETRAETAAARLKAMISVTATVLRSGQTREVPLQQLVPGDVVKLSAGDMVPGDVRLLSAKDLFVIQATLTGESLPVEKSEARGSAPEGLGDRARKPLLFGNQRGERLGHRRHCRDRATNVLWQDGAEPGRAAS